MPFYQRRGEVPRKRHIVFRENGRLLTEEVMGLEGFTGNESILYHLESPCRVKELGGEAGEATPVPSMGWFAACKDVDGNEFGLWQTDPNASM